MRSNQDAERNGSLFMGVLDAVIRLRWIYNILIKVHFRNQGFDFRLRLCLRVECENRTPKVLEFSKADGAEARAEEKNSGFDNGQIHWFFWRGVDLGG